MLCYPGYRKRACFMRRCTCFKSANYSLGCWLKAYLAKNRGEHHVTLLSTRPMDIADNRYFDRSTIFTECGLTIRHTRQRNFTLG